VILIVAASINRQRRRHPTTSESQVAVTNSFTGLPTVVVDCDPGIDDALALLALAELARRTEVRVELVTTARGNVSAQRAAINARYIVEQCALSGCPVLPGANIGLSPSPLSTTEPSMHGVDGLGGLGPPDGPRQGEHHDADAIDELARWMKDDVTILSLAPLTNIATALDRLSGRRTAANIVLMGGAFGAPAGNVTPWAEFNFASDPAAARAVLEGPLDATIVPLDVTQRVRFDAGDLKIVRERALNPLVSSLIQANLDLHRHVLGLEHCYIHDAVALMLMVAPELMSAAHGQLSVTVEGERAGQVLLHQGHGPATVALDVDAQQAKRRLLELWVSTP
jgi:purine nucleosidase